MPDRSLPAGSRPQRTLATSIGTRGVGVHGGLPVTLQLHPAAPGHGIVFQRSDLPVTAARIPARWDRVVDTRLCTMIGNAHGTTVSTIEHLMAALRACGIDNALVELDGPEVPILDGSAALWLALIDRAGTVAQTARRREILVQRALRVDIGGDRWAMLLPHAQPRFTATIDFEDPAIGRQRFDTLLDEHTFRRDIAAARTFGFMADIRALQATGRTLGGSMDNAVVVDRGRVLNPGGLRFPDEFVRHKLLDSIGDVYLAGAPIVGHLIANRPGHALNAALVQALHANADAWRWSTGTEAATASKDLVLAA